jgi:thiosulfate/3-mercaptopyruvate sulfurtransferase
MPYTTLISTADLAANLAAGWVVADCRYDLQREDWGREQYLIAHIPGAVYVDLARHLSAPLTGTNGRHPLPSHDEMAATFGRLGMERDVQVVAYDQNNGMFASRLWWMLRYAGHAHVAVLDGGWARWTAEQLPVRPGDEPRPPVTFVPDWRTEVRVDLDDVVEMYQRPGTLLIDARAPERFQGQTEPLDRIAGHIPGATNHPYGSNLAADGTMLPPAVLHEQFQRTLAGRAPTDAVLYCGSGVTACQNVLAMEHAGLRGARLYPGSWSEWSSDPARPVETGRARQDGR